MNSKFWSVLLLTLSQAAAQTAVSQPVHYQVVYTRIYADDVEAGKTGNLGPGLQLPRGASVTTDPSLAISGKASSNGTIVIQDGAYYGQKITVSTTGSLDCAGGSTGVVLSGKFQRKEGFGTISLNNCPTP